MKKILSLIGLLVGLACMAWGYVAKSMGVEIVGWTVAIVSVCGLVAFWKGGHK